MVYVCVLLNLAETTGLIALPLGIQIVSMADYNVGMCSNVSQISKHFFNDS